RHLALAVILGHLQAGRVHADAGLEHQAEGQAHGHRQHRGDREPQEGPAGERGDRALAGERPDRAHHGEEHQRDRDHLDQVDVDRAQRPEPGPGRRAHQPARERAQREARGHALPEGDLEPGVDQGHRRPRIGRWATLAHGLPPRDARRGTPGVISGTPAGGDNACRTRRRPGDSMIRTTRLALPALCACLAVACAAPGAPGPRAVAQAGAVHVEVPAIARPEGETPAWWYRSGAAAAAANGAMAGRARNVIVFLGDGMSLTTVAAARIFAGQREGAPGEEHRLAWEHFPATALSRTYNTDAQTPDSAGTMTAIATGVKT